RRHGGAVAARGRARAAGELTDTGSRAEDRILERELGDRLRWRGGAGPRRRGYLHGRLHQERRNRPGGHARMARDDWPAGRTDPPAARGVHDPDPGYLRGARRYRAVAGGRAGSGSRYLQGADRRHPGGGPLTLRMLYGDFEGGQRVITQFAVRRGNQRWLASAARHFNVDRPEPR